MIVIVWVLVWMGVWLCVSGWWLRWGCGYWGVRGRFLCELGFWRVGCVASRVRVSCGSVGASFFGCLGILTSLPGSIRGASFGLSVAVAGRTYGSFW